MPRPLPSKPPVETSSRRPVSVLRQIVKVPKRISHDPRFSSEHGKFDRDQFKQDYSWLVDIQEKEHQAREKELKTLKQLKGPEKTEKQWERQKQLKSQIAKYWLEKKTERQEEKVREVQKQTKQKRFLRKGEKKELLLAEQFKQLKESNKLDEWLAKKRRKHTEGRQGAMPAQRPRAP
eukprot:EG_transcript_25220